MIDSYKFYIEFVLKSCVVLKISMWVLINYYIIEREISITLILYCRGAADMRGDLGVPGMKLN